MESGAKWRGVLETIRRAATASGREQTGYFSLEGTRLHERAWRADIPVAAALLTRSYQQDPSARIQALLAGLVQSGCRLHIVSDDIIQTITHGRGLGDIVGLVKIPPPADLAALLAAETVRPPLLLVGVEIADPGNVGALVRTAHAIGAVAFAAVGSEGRSDPFHPKAVRTAMGSLFKLPIACFASLPPLQQLLRAQQIQMVGTAAQGGVLLPQATFASSGAAIFMGNEYWGLADAAALDLCVTIPICSGVDSLSVNAAAAILLYEARRRLWPIP
ncbi:MAG: RNA methyltransferase [Candidatus Promineifilaceae bacterium]